MKSEVLSFPSGLKTAECRLMNGTYPLYLCFLDESGNSETFVMGCAFSSERKWLRLEKEWRKALAEYGIPYFHMREMVGRNGPFSGWSTQKADRLIKKLIWIFTTYVSMWNGTIISVRDYNAIIETDKRKKQRNPYFHAFQTCLSATMIYCQQKSIEGKIGFVFDSGSMSPMHAAGYFEAFKVLETMPNRDQIGALRFEDDKTNSALQAADLLAYELHKYANGFHRQSFKLLRRMEHGITVWDRDQLSSLALPPLRKS
jgi:Protein of unknown function (DUF3800)